MELCQRRRSAKSKKSFLRKLGLDLGLPSKGPKKKQNSFQEIKNIVEMGMHKLCWWTKEDIGAETLFQRMMEICDIVKVTVSHDKVSWKPPREYKINLLKLLKYSVKFIKYSQNIYYTVLCLVLPEILWYLGWVKILVLLIETQIKPIVRSKAKPRIVFLQNN